MGQMGMSPAPAPMGGVSQPSQQLQQNQNQNQNQQPGPMGGHQMGNNHHLANLPVGNGQMGSTQMVNQMPSQMPVMSDPDAGLTQDQKVKKKQLSFIVNQLNKFRLLL